MSGEGPESIPTSADPRSRRPTKKRVLGPSTSQAASLDALFAKPDQEIRIPPSITAAAGGGGGAGGGHASRRPPPPEIITNVQGSSAGAGSGEFHVYKAARRREYERLKEMDEQVKREREQSDFEKTKAEKDLRDEEKTRKNREKREKMKARKMMNKGSSNSNNNNKDKCNGNSNGPLSADGDATTEDKGKPSTPATDRANRQDSRREKNSLNGGSNKPSKREDSPPRAAAEPVGIVIHDDD